MPIMIDDIENVYKNVLAEIIAIRKNKKRPDTKDIKDHVNKNFTDAEEELTEGIVMELLKDIMENRPIAKGRF